MEIRFNKFLGRVKYHVILSSKLFCRLVGFMIISCFLYGNSCNASGIGQTLGDERLSERSNQVPTEVPEVDAPIVERGELPENKIEQPLEIKPAATIGGYVYICLCVFYHHVLFILNWLSSQKSVKKAREESRQAVVLEQEKTAAASSSSEMGVLLVQHLGRQAVEHEEDTTELPPAQKVAPQQDDPTVE